MTFHIVMKDGTHRAYDGVFEIRESRGVIFIRYYSAHSAKLTAEHALSKIQSMYYGRVTTQAEVAVVGQAEVTEVK